MLKSLKRILSVKILAALMKNLYKNRFFVEKNVVKCK